MLRAPFFAAVVMTALTLPAPLWRRLIAAVYDGLLLLGIWMIVALADVILRDQLLGLPRHPPTQMAGFFLAGLAFFGWFWTHGGQTLGMRAWRLRVRRHDGQPLRWPTAAVRYAVMLAVWMSLPIVAALLSSSTLAATHPQAGLLCSIVGTVLTAALLLFLRDPLRRAPQDWLSRCEMVVEPA